MGALITVLFLAVVGWNTFTQIMARQQTSISCSYDVATARGIVSRSFGMWWKAVPGNGEDNYKSKRGSSAPTLSISYDVGEGGGCHVDIWCSHGTKRYGVLNHAQLAWRKKRAVARALAREELARSQPLAQPGRNETAGAISRTQQAPALPAIGAMNHFGLVGADRIGPQRPGERIDEGPVQPLRVAPPASRSAAPSFTPIIRPGPPTARSCAPVAPPGQPTVPFEQRPRGRHSRSNASAEAAAAPSGVSRNRVLPVAEKAGGVNVGPLYGETRIRPRRATGSAAGSSIMKGWLNELEAAQPRHGPLLQSTLDQVGNLPAVGDDGSIYTVSHDRYWYAAGYARSYTSTQADNRHIAAVLAEAKAKETKDEPTMVRKEAEAEFWETVKAWVDSAAPSRMAPDVIPTWLARFNPVWNPDGA
jgi:hypothetical protein